MPTPVICDKCAATGLAGDPAFAGVPDILDFTPVPRRPHANGWTDEHQRAFIAAVAITGSAPRAARAIGRHMFGAERLRSARGGRSFAAAWDAALGIARQRELARLHDNLADLARDHAERDALAPGAARPPSRWDPQDDDEDEAGQRELAEQKERIRSRMIGSRRLYLRSIADSEAMRAAWEVLVGPTDWDKARALEPQADETAWGHIPNSRDPAMVLAADAGLLPYLTEGDGPPTYHDKFYDPASAATGHVTASAAEPPDDADRAMLAALAAARGAESESGSESAEAKPKVGEADT